MSHAVAGTDSSTAESAHDAAGGNRFHAMVSRRGWSVLFGTPFVVRCSKHEEAGLGNSFVHP